MEELKLLVEMVRNLPNTALWVIALLFAYKVVCVGSVYGVLRFAIDRLHSWLTTPKHELRKVTVEMEGQIRGICITDHAEAFIAQLYRLRGKRCGIDSQYLHLQSVEWLREAIDAKEALDAEAARAKASAA